MIRIASAELAATISPTGAELRSLTAADGAAWLWDGDPAWWTGRAPILFPIVGAVAGGVVRIDGTAYPMAKHGFVRGAAFAVVDQADAAVTLRLAVDDAIRAAYPFAFALDVRFAVAGTTLTVQASVTNAGDRPMPASFGFHPAFLWPLPGAGFRADHIVRFDTPEPAPIRRIDASGLVMPVPQPTPVEGDTLHPTDAMFADDALIWDRLASRGLWFGVPGRPGIRIEHPDLPMLGIWTKPGAPYLCLEPWQGIADPQGFAGELKDKPGIIAIPPQDTRHFTMRITVGAEG